MGSTGGAGAEMSCYELNGILIVLVKQGRLPLNKKVASRPPFDSFESTSLKKKAPDYETSFSSHSADVHFLPFAFGLGL